MHLIRRQQTPVNRQHRIDHRQRGRCQGVAGTADDAVVQLQAGVLLGHIGEFQQADQPLVDQFGQGLHGGDTHRVGAHHHAADRIELRAFHARVEVRLALRVGEDLADHRRYSRADHRVVEQGAQGEADFNPSVECAQFDAIRRVVMRSDAVGIATIEALAELADQGLIRLLEFADVPKDDPGLQLHYGIVSRAGHSLTPAALAMVEAVLTVDRRLLASN